MKKIKQLLLAAIVISGTAMFLNSCKPTCEKNPSDPECLGENELITSLNVIVTDSATGLSIGTYRFQDLDGAGSNPPAVFDTIKLVANKTYIVSLQFWNDAAQPAEDLTPQIQEEKNDHFVSIKANNATVDVFYRDKDDNNLPIGLLTEWKTGAIAMGTISVILHHQPNLKDGTELPGDTDIQVDFPLEIQ